MKTFCVTTMTVLLLLLCSNATQAQTTQTKLNQVSLMKKWIGSWKCEISKDTFEIQDIIAYGNAYEDNISVFTKDNILDSIKSIWGYDKINDKFICAGISKSSPDMILVAFWFTSETTCGEVYLKDISNPEKANIKWEWEFKSPDIAICKYEVNNKVVGVFNYTREKK